MKTKEVNIDFDVLSQTVGQSMLRLAREKAIKANSTIVYKEDAFLIEENPATGERTIIKEQLHED